MTQGQLRCRNSLTLCRSRYVRRIVFSPLCFDDHSNDAIIHTDSKCLFKVGPNANPREKAQTLAERSKYRAARQKYAAERRRFEPFSGSSYLLRPALKRLSHLQAVDIMVASTHIGSKEVEKAFGRTNGDEYNFECYMLLPVLIRAIRACRSTLASFRIIVENAEEYTLDVARSSSKGQGSLILTQPSPSYDIPSGYPIKPIDLKTFRKLKVLEITPPNFPCLCPSQPYHRLCAPLNQIMESAASNVEKLYVNAWSNRASENNILFKRLSNLQMPYIRMLRLGRVSWDHSDFLEVFFKYHCHSLREVKVQYGFTGFLAMNFWQNHIQILRCLEWSILRDFLLGWDDERHYAENVARYLRRETDEEPLISLFKQRDGQQCLISAEDQE